MLLFGQSDQRHGMAWFEACLNVRVSRYSASSCQQTICVQTSDGLYEFKICRPQPIDQYQAIMAALDWYLLLIVIRLSTIYQSRADWENMSPTYIHIQVCDLVLGSGRAHPVISLDRKLYNSHLFLLEAGHRIVNREDSSGTWQ